MITHPVEWLRQWGWIKAFDSGIVHGIFKDDYEGCVILSTRLERKKEALTHLSRPKVITPRCLLHFRREQMLGSWHWVICRLFFHVVLRSFIIDLRS